MSPSTASPTAGRWPARVIIIDDHEISRAAFAALLRAEGINVTAGLNTSGQVITAARAHRPDVAIIDVTPAADTGFAIAQALLALPAPPTVILTSSTGRAHFGAQLNGHHFIAKADICAATITRLARSPQTDGQESPNRRACSETPSPGESPPTLAQPEQLADRPNQKIGEPGHETISHT